MRRLTIPTLVFLSFLQAAAAADESAKNPDTAKAKGCTTCHNMAVNLKARGVDVIVSQIRAIRAGDKQHLPAFAEMKDEEIEEIAAYLNGG